MNRYSRIKTTVIRKIRGDSSATLAGVGALFRRSTAYRRALFAGRSINATLSLQGALIGRHRLPAPVVLQKPPALIRSHLQETLVVFSHLRSPLGRELIPALEI